MGSNGCKCNNGFVWVQGKRVVCPICNGKTAKEIVSEDSCENTKDKLLEFETVKRVNVADLKSKNYIFDRDVLSKDYSMNNYSPESVDKFIKFLSTGVNKAQQGEYIKGTYFLHMPDTRGYYLDVWGIQVLNALKEQGVAVTEVISLDFLCKVYEQYLRPSDTEYKSEYLSRLYGNWEEYLLAPLVIIDIPRTVQSDLGRYMFRILTELLRRRNMYNLSTYVLSPIHDLYLLNYGFKYLLEMSSTIIDRYFLQCICLEPKNGFAVSKTVDGQRSNVSVEYDRSFYKSDYFSMKPAY